MSCEKAASHRCLAHLERDPNASHKGTALLGRFYLPEDRELFPAPVQFPTQPSPAPKLPLAALGPTPTRPPSTGIMTHSKVLELIDMINLLGLGG